MRKGWWVRMCGGGGRGRRLGDRGDGGVGWVICAVARCDGGEVICIDGGRVGRMGDVGGWSGRCLCVGEVGDAYGERGW